MCAADDRWVVIAVRCNTAQVKRPRIIFFPHLVAASTFSTMDPPPVNLDRGRPPVSPSRPRVEARRSMSSTTNVSKKKSKVFVINLLFIELAKTLFLQVLLLRPVQARPYLWPIAPCSQAMMLQASWWKDYTVVYVFRIIKKNCIYCTDHHSKIYLTLFLQPVCWRVWGLEPG